MRLKRHLLTLTTAGGLAALGFGAGPVTHVFAGPSGAPSGFCNDNGTPDEVPIITTPFVLGVEIGNAGSPTSGHFALCYSTTPANSSGPEVSGGYIAVDAPGYNSPGTDDLGCVSDPTPVGVNCWFATTPTVSANGSSLTVTIPFSVCVGVGSCPTVTNPGTQPYTTGVIVGNIAAAPCGANPGCVSAAYSLSSVCVEVDGIPVAGVCNTALGQTGVTTTGSAPVWTANGGPCVNGTCLPLTGNSSIGVSGAQLATIWIAGVSIPVNGVHLCYQASATSPPCPF